MESSNPRPDGLVQSASNEASPLASTADGPGYMADDEARHIARRDYINLKLSDIDVRGRIRQDLGDVEELAESIRDNGLLQPIVVEEVTVGGEFEDSIVYRLRCGGRRYTALTLLESNKVKNPNPQDYSIVSCRLFTEMPEHQRVKIELEENLRRLSMTWQEKVVGIVRYHKAARRAAKIDGDSWTQAMTGDLFNMSQASISIAFTLYEAIQAGNEKVIKAENSTEALKVLASAELDASQAEQMRRINLKRTEATRVQSQEANALPRVSSLIISTSEQKSPETIVDKIQFTKEQIADFYYEGDCLDILPRLKTEGRIINHIITDPPYGIDMSNLVMEGVSRVEETHKVKDNLELLPKFLEVSFNAIAEDGFLCMWYDLDHHEKIHKWATEIGWRVQRWPFVWCKSPYPPQRNSQAQYNFTKSTEVCYIMRRSEHSILKNKQSRNYVEAASCASSDHPFVKPHKVWEVLIDAVSSPGQVIFDGFAGNGSSLAAMFKGGRVPIGAEVDPKHIASGLSYVQELINKKSVLDDILAAPPI